MLVEEPSKGLMLHKAADKLGMSGAEVGRLIDSGQLPLERQGKWLVIPESAIDEYLTEHAAT